MNREHGLHGSIDGRVRRSVHRGLALPPVAERHGGLKAAVRPTPSTLLLCPTTQRSTKAPVRRLEANSKI